MRIAQTNQKDMKQEPCIGHEREHSSVAGMVMKTCCFIAAFVAVMVGMPFSSMAQIPLVYAIENTGTNYPAPPLPTLANCPFIQPLPDPFNWANDPRDFGGTRSTNFADWEHHRNEIAAQIENYEIGTKPAVDIPSQVTASYSGSTSPGGSGTLTVHVTANGQTLTLTCAVSIPSGATAPYPICIGMDSPYGSLTFSDFTSRGIAGVTFSESQVSVYNSPSSSDPYYKLYPSLWGNSGQYSAWAWGVSRVIDGLTLVTNTLPIDLNHICVTGCSYAGKLALFAGAFDERVALTIAQESGGGGDTSWRYSATEPTGTVEGLAQTSTVGFRSSMFQFGGANVSYLPEDHHELMAMCAPRALYCTANTDYLWLSNPSAYVCGEACARIYATLGIADRFGFNVDGGHSHCTFPSDQESDLQYFLNKFMKGQTNLSSTNATAPSSYSSIDYARWSAWWGTTNPVFPYNGQLSLSIPASATKGDGTLAGQGRLSVSPTPTNDVVVVNLTSSDTSKVTVPASVVIPAGQSNAVFDLTIIDDSLLDGDQWVIIKASSQLCANAPQALITVHDNNTATLSVALPASAVQSAGTLVNGGLVSIGTAVAANFTVSLSSSDTSKLIVPPTTVLSIGQTSAVFNLTFVSNNIIEGPQTVSVTAHVPNWTDGTASLTILDDNPLPDHFAWSAVSSPQLIGEPFPVTITAQDSANNTLDYRLPVTLSALSAGNATGTNTILNSPSAEYSEFDPGSEYTLGYSFTPSTNLAVTHVRHYFGDKVSIWTDSGLLLASQNVVSVPGTWVDTALSNPVLLIAGSTYRIATHVTNTNYYWSSDLPKTFADGVIDVTWYDVGDVFPEQMDPSYQWFFVDLRYATDVSSVPVSPVQTPDFGGGVWSGDVSVLQAATNVMLLASAGAGNFGVSVPFNVLVTPKLAIAALSNSVVLSWPAAWTGAHLQVQTNSLTIGLSNNWVTIPGTDASNSYTITPDNSNGTVFYRLAP